MLTAIVILSASESVFFTLSPTKTTLLYKVNNYHYSTVYYLCRFSSPQLLTKSLECGTDKDDIINALKTNPYGRCVYRCDNDVCDHQIAALEFENGVCAVFTVSAFSLRNARTIKLMGTEGEIGGCMEDGEITLRRFCDESETKISVTHDNTKHCGGDGGLMDYFTSALEDTNYKTDHKIFEAHALAFEAEKSRLDSLLNN